MAELLMIEDGSLDGFYSKIGLDKEALENLKYSLKLETISKDPSLFNNEVIFIRKKIDEIKSEINQLENNLQFFSNVDDDNPLVKEVHKKIPILGVCLGHQIIGQVFDSKIIQANKLMHGKTSKIKHLKKGLLRNIQNNFELPHLHHLFHEDK